MLSINTRLYLEGPPCQNACRHLKTFVIRPEKHLATVYLSWKWFHSLNLQNVSSAHTQKPFLWRMAIKFQFKIFNKKHSHLLHCWSHLPNWRCVSCLHQWKEMDLSNNIRTIRWFKFVCNATVGYKEIHLSWTIPLAPIIFLLSGWTNGW